MVLQLRPGRTGGLRLLGDGEGLHLQTQETGGRSLVRGNRGRVKAASGSRNTLEALDAAAVAMAMLAAGSGGQVDQ